MLLHIDSISSIRGYLPEAGLLVITGRVMSGKTTLAKAIVNNWPAARLTDEWRAEQIVWPAQPSPSLRHYLQYGPMSKYLQEVRAQPDDLHVLAVRMRKGTSPFSPRSTPLIIPLTLLSAADAVVIVEAQAPSVDPPFRSSRPSGTILLQWYKSRHQPMAPDVLASAESLRREG